jgi:hypothetical protein
MRLAEAYERYMRQDSGSRLGAFDITLRSAG